MYLILKRGNYKVILGSTLGMVIMIIVGILLIVFGILIRIFKIYKLVSGYGNATEEEKKNIDIEGLSLFLRNYCFILAIIMFACAYCVHYSKAKTLVVLVVLFVAVLAFMVFNIKKYDKNEYNPRVRKRTIVSITILAFITIGAFLIISLVYGSMPAAVNIKGNTLDIRAAHGLKIPLNSVEDITLENTAPAVNKRVIGFQRNNIYKGEFKVKNVGDTRLYLQNKKGPFIYIKTERGYIIINLQNPDKTRKLYKLLKVDYNREQMRR